MAIDPEVLNAVGIVSLQLLQGGVKKGIALEAKDAKKSGKVKVVAQGVNFGKFVEERVDPAGTVVVKMDIEGAEYELMRDLISSGRLCKKDAQGNNLFDYMNVEFHPFEFTSKDDGWTPKGAEVAKVAKWIMHKCGIVYSPNTD